MKISTSIRLIWQVAAQEAATGGFEEIEREHFLMATLTLSELRLTDLEKVAADSEMAQELSKEVRATRHELARYSIDSTRLRRKLRRLMGRAGGKVDAERLHRSAASRLVFEAALDLVDRTRSSTLRAPQLLGALLGSTGSIIEDALGRSPERPAPESDTPLLDSLGEDLGQVVGERMPAEARARLAEGAALLGVLAKRERKCMILVAERHEDARSAAIAAAHVLENEETPGRIKGHRIVQIPSGLRGKKREEQECEQLSQLLAEAGSHPGVVLFLQVPDLPSGHATGKGWTDHLKAALESGPIQCIFSMNPAQYERWTKEMADVKRLMHTMWLRPGQSSELPREL